MKIELYQFVDFDGMFNYLFEEQKETLTEHRYEAIHYDRILTFLQQKQDYKLELEECSITRNSISFLYIKSLNDANESTTRSTECSFHIVFDMALDEFIICEYECA